jgi:hypothetical protein
VSAHRGASNAAKPFDEASKQREEEIQCDLFAARIFLEMDEQYTRRRVAPDFETGELEPIFDDGVPHVAGLYDFVMAAIFISQEINAMIRHIRSDTYNPAQQRDAFAFAMHRASRSAAHVEKIFGPKLQQYRRQCQLRDDTATEVLAYFSETASLVQNCLAGHAKASRTLWDRFELINSWDEMYQARDATARVWSAACEELGISRTWHGLLVPADRTHPGYENFERILRWMSA